MPRQLTTRMEGLVLIEPDVHSDGRGFFMETYRSELWEELGVTASFVQDNHSRSSARTIRGLHFQTEPGQPKLVRLARGRAWDVVVDLRRSSPTFGQWEAFELDDVQHRQLFIPVGFAHGFCALSETVDFVYKVGSYYDAAAEKGIAWDDPDLAIDWPVSTPLISNRDRDLPRLRDVIDELPGW